MADLDHLAEENERLKQTSDKLDSKLQEEKALRRKVEKKLSKSKSRTEHFQNSLLQLCRNISSNQNTEESVEELITQLFERDVQSGNLLRSLASAVNKPAATKSTRGIYNDNLALLTMELVNMGVSQEAVGKVMKACTTHLAGRTLESVVSRRTAGRMIRRGGILIDAQVAMELESNASRGVRVGQDTTTRRGTEHVSTVWGVRKEDGFVRYLQSRVQWLPNHTADVQTEHILQQMYKGRELLEKLNLQSQQAMSIAHIVEFIGDHVNNKLHKHLQDHHMRELSHLIESEEIDLATQTTLSSLYKSACQQHSCAKVSCSFFEGMQEKEPANFGAAFGRFGLKQKKGRTYEAASAKVIEFTSSQFSPDYANTVSVDFNWADVFRGWCEANNRTYHHIGYVNKNRHYRHEKEAFTILMLAAGIVDFYESRRATRDPDGEQTLRNKDQLVFEGLQSDDIKAQLTAADAMRFSFHQPFGVMIKDTATDVLSVAKYIQEAGDFLTNASTDCGFAASVLEGCQKLYHEAFPSPPNVKRPVGVTLHPLLQDLAAEYLQAGCQKAAAGLRKISSEYFEGGQYHQPTHHMFEVLTGHEAHTDGNESDFGHLSQQLRKEPTARLQTVNSKVAMRANDTIITVRNCPELLAVVGQTRKLEREESLKTIRVQLSDLAQLNEPHLAELREVAARRHNRRLQKERQLLEAVHQQGVAETVADVTNLLSSAATKAAKLKLLKTQIQHKRSRFPEFAAQNKQPFVFSREKWQLTVLELKTNLEAVVAGCANPALAVTEDRVLVTPAHQDQPQDLPDGTDQPQELDVDSDASDSDHDAPPSPLVNNVDSVLSLSEDVSFDKGATVAVAFLDRWYPGIVLDTFDQEDARVSFLHPVRSDQSCNVFRWPNRADVQDVNIRATLCKGLQLTPQGTSARNFVLSQADTQWLNDRFEC